MRMLELFSGSSRMRNAFAQRRYITASVDTHHPATSNKDVRDLTRGDIVRMLGGEPQVIWASPPCQAFSVATIGRNWTRLPDGSVMPETDKAREGIELLHATLNIIRMFPDAVYFIENPRGMMRKMPELQRMKRHTITFCAYGENRMKPTDIWTNSNKWVPRPACKNGDPCHESAPRGSRTGTQGVKGAYLRGALPYELCREIAEAHR